MSLSIGQPSGARATSGAEFRNPEIGNLAAGLNQRRSDNQEGAAVLKDALQSFKSGQIDGKELLETYDSLKASGVKGPAMEEMEKLFHKDSDARKFINEADGPNMGMNKELRAMRVASWANDALNKMPETPNMSTQAKSVGDTSASASKGFEF
ncbi:hypothetical protein ACSFA3_01170 [Variovorax sp. RHLX14]|uniref:hypothetical protein n=1 Tax=Variovorax sp. RHLX14 TaxID=1259731 RepID=UPI003F48BE5B